jgi:imidazolonepropionase-like amidohydrolase
MGTILIRGGRLIDGTGGPAVEPAVLLIAGGVIEAVGAEAAARAAEASEVWDCGNQTLLPGLIDCHNHLSLDPTLDNYLHRMNDPLPELTLRAVNSMRVDLMAGVTTSRCLGDKGFLDIACRKASAARTLLGPRLLAATRGIRAPHGHGFVGYPFGCVEQIRSAVRENLQAGTDLIKVYITGTLRGPGQILPFYSREEVGQRLAAAIRAGVRYAVGTDGMHAGLAREIAYLVELGATPAAALRAATADAARVCGLGDRTGTLQKGKWADCIGVEGNPLEDPGALKRVRTVILQGRLAKAERGASQP